MTVDTMSDEVFRENASQIVAEVRTIRSAKGKTRRRFRIVAIYERSSGLLLGEVLRTSFGPVVVYRTAVMAPAACRDMALVGYRQDRTCPGLEPFTGHPSQFFSMVSTKGNHYPATGADIIARTWGVRTIRARPRRVGGRGRDRCGHRRAASGVGGGGVVPGPRRSG